jgi:uncharacterized membrane protein YbhN (UPF0104 family)
MKARPRIARMGITGAIGAASLALLLWVAPPGRVLAEIGSMNPAWVGGAIGLEIASCLSYVVIFRRFFPEPPRRVGRRVAWMAMGAGAVLPGGNISSAAATGLLLRRHGVPNGALIRRCATLLCLLTGFGFLVNGVAALLLLVRVPDGPHDLAHTGGPILVSIGVLGTATLAVALARRLGERAPRPLRGVAAGLEGAWRVALQPHWRLLGGAGFLCLDMAALWAACAATGHRLGLLAVTVAYCIGYLATIVPVPAGIGVLDSGLAGALVLYGMSPIAAVGAVLVYHAISIWVPGLGGLAAWLTAHIRGERRPGEPVAPGPGLGAGLAPRRAPAPDASRASAAAAPSSTPAHAVR